MARLVRAGEGELQLLKEPTMPSSFRKYHNPYSWAILFFMECWACRVILQVAVSKASTRVLLEVHYQALHNLIINQSAVIPSIYVVITKDMCTLATKLQSFMTILVYHEVIR